MVQKPTPHQDITRENHYLPVCYQQSFTNDEGELCVQFFNKNRPIYLHPTSVGKINDFYTRTVNGVDDDAVEKFFSTFVEGGYATVSKRIKEKKDEFVLQRHEVPILLKFVAAQIVRTQAHRMCIDEQAGVKVDQDIFIHNMQRKMRLITDRWRRHCPDMILWTTLPHLRSQFITGDNPVLCFSHAPEEPYVRGVSDATPKIIDLSVSLESPHNGFFVPLSLHVGLTIINSGHRDSILLRPARCTDPRVVRHFNRLIYRQCVQFVAARGEQFLTVRD